MLRIATLYIVIIDIAPSRQDARVRPDQQLLIACNTAAMIMKKALRETQTLRAAVVRRSPAADPIPGGAGRPKFNQLETVTTFTYRPSLVKIDARNFELSW